MSAISGRALGGAAGVVAIAATDTTIANPGAGTTFDVYEFYAHDRSGTGTTLEIFVSSDAASAAGERVRYVSIGANETKTLEGLTVPAGYFLIGKAGAADRINITGKYTYRDGSSV